MPVHPFKKRVGRVLIFVTVVIVAAATGWSTSPHWLPLVKNAFADRVQPANSELTVDADVESESNVVKITSQARANLGLTCTPAELQTFWKKIETTGVIVDRPGFTDQGITTPVDCFVSGIHAYEGDIVRPGDKLFTLRLTSQYLQQTQSDYFKALREIEILNAEIERLDGLANRGIIPEKRIIELDQNLKRQKVEIQAHRQDLIARGLGIEQLQQIAEGEFIKTIDVRVPKQSTNGIRNNSLRLNTAGSVADQTLLELQELKVELGEKAQAGQILTVLANHNHLYINGFGFKKEAAHIARAAEIGWEIDVEFIESEGGDWPPMTQPLKIRHLSNSVDLESRTFDFFIPLSNQSRSYTQEGRTFVIWRFRPGQRVRIKIPFEKMENVFVFPTAAVVSEGPDSYVFQQNGELFNRIPVHILHQDRENTVVADDGGIARGFYISCNSAAVLNRILKSQSASGDNMNGFHVHADGSVHANH